MTLTVLLRIKFRKRIPKSKVDFFHNIALNFFLFGRSMFFILLEIYINQI